MYDNDNMPLPEKPVKQEAVPMLTPIADEVKMRFNDVTPEDMAEFLTDIASSYRAHLRNSMNQYMEMSKNEEARLSAFEDHLMK